MKRTSRCSILLAVYLATALLTGCEGSSDSISPSDSLGPIPTWTNANTSNSPTTVGPGTGDPVPFVPPSEPLTGSYLYVTETEGDALGVYDAGTYQLVARVPVGDSPRGLSFDTSRERVLVSLTGGSVVSLDSNDLQASPQTTAPVVDDGSLALFYDLANDAVWVSSLSETNNVVALAAATLAHLSNSPTLDSDLNGMGSIEVEPSGEHAYFTRSVVDSPAVAVIDATTRTLLHVIDTSGSITGTGKAADGVSYDSARDRLYVGNVDFSMDGEDSVVILDAALDPPPIIGQVLCGPGPTSIAFDSARSRLYVTNFNSAAVQVFSISATAPYLTLVQTLPCEGDTVSVVYDSEHDRIVASNYTFDNLSVFNAATLQELPGSPFPAGDGPNSLCFGNPTGP